MAATTKTSGLGDDLYADGFHIGGDIQSLVVNGGPETLLDVTDITQSAHARLGGLRAAAPKMVAFHDSAVSGTATSAHNAFSPLLTTDYVVSYLHGQALGNPVYCCNTKQVNYDPTRAADGMLTFAINNESNGFGAEWGVQLTASPRTDITPTTGAAFDQASFLPFLSGGTFGAQAYLHLVSLTGTNVDVSITHATTSGGSYSSLIDFGSLTSAPTSVRGTAAGTVNEFLKVVTTGTFSSAVFFVAFMLNPVAVVF